MRTLALVLGVLAIGGCDGAAPEPPSRAVGPPPLAESEQGNFILYVSNQSFERGNVDIRVLLDGRPAVEDDFAVKDQHNWVEYRFSLDDGRHALRAESVEGDALLDATFTVKGNRWAVVDYWCCSDGTEPKFTFLVRRQPIAFA
jgi:hypothetical protein